MMRNLLLSCICIFLLSCGDSGPPQSKTYSPNPPDNIPIRVFDPESGLIEQAPLDSDWWATVRWQGPENISFKQLNVDRYASVINTHGICKDGCAVPFREVIGGGPHNVVSYNRTSKTQPVSSGIRFEWYQSIESFESSRGVGQLSIFFYIRHLSGYTVAILVNTYDNRVEFLDYTPRVDNDTYTYYFTTPISNSEYLISNQSHSYTPKPWQQYIVTLHPFHLQKILDKFMASGIGLPSRNLDEYGIFDTGIIHEIFTFNDSTVKVKSGVTFSTLKVEKLN